MDSNGILVVDDHPDIRELFRCMLEDAGHAVCAAEDGHAALESLGLLARSGSLPGVILLNLSMPLMSGGELLAALRRDSRFAHIPVVAITASSVAKPPLATVLLRKPVDPDDLVRCVRELREPYPSRHQRHA